MTLTKHSFSFGIWEITRLAMWIFGRMNRYQTTIYCKCLKQCWMIKKKPYAFACEESEKKGFGWKKGIKYSWDMNQYASCPSRWCSLNWDVRPTQLLGTAFIKQGIPPFYRKLLFISCSMYIRCNSHWHGPSLRMCLCRCFFLQCYKTSQYENTSKHLVVL